MTEFQLFLTLILDFWFFLCRTQIRQMIASIGPGPTYMQGHVASFLHLPVPWQQEGLGFGTQAEACGLRVGQSWCRSMPGHLEEGHRKEAPMKHRSFGFYAQTLYCLYGTL